MTHAVVEINTYRVK